MNLSKLFVGFIIFSSMALVSGAALADCPEGQETVDNGCVYSGNPAENRNNSMTVRDFQMLCLMADGNTHAQRDPLLHGEVGQCNEGLQEWVCCLQP